MYREAFTSLILSLSILGCESDEVEPPLPDASTPELTRFGPPRAVAPLVLGDTLSISLAPSTPTKLFSFTLDQPASISLRTQPGSDGRVVDTVLRLSRIDTHGVPRAIATSDDFDHTPFSGLDRTLSKGDYRVAVYGATVRTEGSFALSTSCKGPGCPPPPAECLFGEQFNDLRDATRFDVLSEVWVTSEAQLTTAVERNQVVLAVQQSTHTDVTTPAEAIAVVDEHEVRHMEVRQHDGTRAFTVFEYGVGDNSYGAVFTVGTVAVAASIHDGEFENCTAMP